jgi:biotin carboxyl carrier protein
MVQSYRHGTRQLSVTLQRGPAEHFLIGVDGDTREVEVVWVDDSTLRLIVAGRAYTAVVARAGDTAYVAIGGAVYVLTPGAGGSDDVGAAAALATPRVVAPMPGKVLQVLVEPGQSVSRGDGLLILEAMKMEHRMTAEAAGTVRALHVVAGQMVAAGAVLVELDYTSAG